MPRIAARPRPFAIEWIARCAGETVREVANVRVDVRAAPAPVRAEREWRKTNAELAALGFVVGHDLRDAREERRYPGVTGRDRARTRHDARREDVHRTSAFASEAE